MGYHRAGFEVIGIDIEPQPYYPFDFIRANALRPPVDFGRFDVIHASPPCQAYSEGGRRFPERQKQHPKLIGPTRDLLQATGLPYVIENVPGARSAMDVSIVLYGGMFGLRVVRRRLFESNVVLLQAPAKKTIGAVGVYGKAPDGRHLNKRHSLYAPKGLGDAQDAMGLDWCDWHGLKEAIPPAYTEFIGRQLL